MTKPFGNTPVEILLVEDNPGDIVLIEEAFHDAGFDVKLNIARDGEEAHVFLRREGKHANAHAPDLILLDLNLPRKDGRELLGAIKSDPTLRRIPVIVLTTSRSERDIAKSYDLHANCYIIKPVGIEALTNVVRSIEHFWLRVSTLPPNAAAAAGDAA